MNISHSIVLLRIRLIKTLVTQSWTHCVDLNASFVVSLMDSSTHRAFVNSILYSWNFEWNNILLTDWWNRHDFVKSVLDVVDYIKIKDTICTVVNFGIKWDIWPDLILCLFFIHLSMWSIQITVWEKQKTSRREN